MADYRCPYKVKWCEVSFKDCPHWKDIFCELIAKEWNKMKKSDFIFSHVDINEPYCDYWFDIVGDTKEELTDKYMEQSMVEVSAAVFGIQDGQWGIKRLFPFNYDVITPSEDEELRNILQNKAFETHKARIMEETRIKEE